MAADPNTFGSSPIGIDYPTSGYTTLVEVHQAAAAISGLWYHVGTVTVTDTGVPALTWGPSYQYDSGFLPSVAVCNAVVIEVHEGQPGPLWSHVGTVSGNTISSGPAIHYDGGYAPSVSCGVNGYVIEVHQAANPTAGDRVGCGIAFRPSPHPRSTGLRPRNMTPAATQPRHSPTRSVIRHSPSLKPTRRLAGTLHRCCTTSGRSTFLDALAAERRRCDPSRFLRRRRECIQRQRRSGQ